MYLGICEHRFLAEEREDVLGLEPPPHGGAEAGQDTVDLLLLEVSLEVVCEEGGASV